MNFRFEKTISDTTESRQICNLNPRRICWWNLWIPNAIWFKHTFPTRWCPRFILTANKSKTGTWQTGGLKFLSIVSVSTRKFHKVERNDKGLRDERVNVARLIQPLFHSPPSSTFTISCRQRAARLFIAAGYPWHKRRISFTRKLGRVRRAAFKRNWIFIANRGTPVNSLVSLSPLCYGNDIMKTRWRGW